MDLKVNKILLYTAWYPEHEKSLKYTFVSQQAKIFEDFIRHAQPECKIVVWHDEKPIDLPSLIKGQREKFNVWYDESVKVYNTKGLVITHRVNSTSSILLNRMRVRAFQSICDDLGGLPDCVWTVTLSAAMNWKVFTDKQKLQIPFFLQEHSNPLTMHLKNSRSRWLAKNLIDSLSRVVVVAHRQLEEVATHIGDVETEVVWNPVDPCFLKEPTASSDPNVMLFVGRLSEQKGLRMHIK